MAGHKNVSSWPFFGFVKGRKTLRSSGKASCGYHLPIFDMAGMMDGLFFFFFFYFFWTDVLATFFVRPFEGQKKGYWGPFPGCPCLVMLTKSSLVFPRFWVRQRSNYALAHAITERDSFNIGASFLTALQDTGAGCGRTPCPGMGISVRAGGGGGVVRALDICFCFVNSFCVFGWALMASSVSMASLLSLQPSLSEVGQECLLDLQLPPNSAETCLDSF